MITLEHLIPRKFLSPFVLLEDIESIEELKEDKNLNGVIDSIIYGLPFKAANNSVEQ